MDKITLQTVFQSFSGYAYRFTGSIPDDAKPFSYISTQYNAVEGGNVKEVQVTKVKNNFIVHSPVEIDDEDFVLLCDLSNPPTDGVPYEPPVEEEPSEE